MPSCSSFFLYLRRIHVLDLIVQVLGHLILLPSKGLLQTVNRKHYKRTPDSNKQYKLPWYRPGPVKYLVDQQQYLTISGQQYISHAFTHTHIHTHVCHVSSSAAHVFDSMADKLVVMTDPFIGFALFEVQGEGEDHQLTLLASCQSAPTFAPFCVQNSFGCAIVDPHSPAEKVRLWMLCGSMAAGASVGMRSTRYSPAPEYAIASTCCVRLRPFSTVCRFRHRRSVCGAESEAFVFGPCTRFLSGQPARFLCQEGWRVLFPLFGGRQHST